MQSKSLKFKILFIFIIPIATILYFSIISVLNEYRKLQESNIIKDSAHITKGLSSLIYNIQIERGLGSGYIVATDKSKYKEQLIKQYKKSDDSYKYLIDKLKDHSNKKIKHKSHSVIQDTIKELNKINDIREAVKNSSINFNNLIKYYANINAKLILAIKLFNSVHDKSNINTLAIIKLEILKEYAGLERAYIYNQLIGGIKPKFAYSMEQLHINQQNTIYEFLKSASAESLNIYNSTFSKEIQNNLQLCKNDIAQEYLNTQNALICFNASTKYIEMFNKISKKIFSNYILKTETLGADALKSLYLTTFLWLVSLISLLILLFISKRALIKNERNINKLRIASYAFEAQEAMIITDTDAKILKVNNSFTEITGYSSEEAVGKNTKFLKSSEHDPLFFENMWNDVLTHGQWQGEIYNKRKNGEIFPERLSITAIKDDNDKTTHYIAQFIDLSDIKKAQLAAEHQADHDFLTNLLNRKSLMQRINEEFGKAVRHNFKHAFLFIDLDNFKAVNDNYGHNIGDMLIIEVSKRLNKSIRDGDILARLSGDEFAIVLLNLNKDIDTAAKEVSGISDKILQVISDEFILENNIINVSSSIGIKIFPNNEKSVQDVITHADTAMYRAKSKGKNQFVFFDKEIETKLLEFSSIAQEIKDGLDNSQFEMYYQPKVHTITGKIDGAELLIRWNHPTKGLVFPDYFIEVANKTKSIYKFTTLALTTACNFINSNKTFTGSLSINVSAKELLFSNFEEKAIDIISTAKINPSQIEIEITEDDLIKDFDIAIRKIKILQKFGIQITIDDFGTGYSSIKYLQKLPIDTIKIDKSLLDDLSCSKNKELLNIMISIGKTFNIKIITEGIEDKSQLEFVIECGSQEYQGYYFSKAVDESSFIKLLTQN
ncbi:MAG: EAL domain-containing protein [Sulfurimonas sp.]|nr:EAL domain-containing protein [Sulfurimonas sp.]